MNTVSPEMTQLGHRDDRLYRQANRILRVRWLVVCIYLLMACLFGMGDSAIAQSTNPDAMDTKEAKVNRADEPLAEQFSMDRATAFLDRSARDWQADYGCVTCHTNGLYLIAGSYGLSGANPNPAYDAVRQFSGEYLDQYTVDNQPPRGQRGAIEGMVATTAFRVISDIRTQGQLDPATRRALDYVWAKQDESGAWVDWLKCGWPPFEQDDHYGVTLMALAVGMAGDQLDDDSAAARGVERLKQYLSAHPPENAHQMGMLLWARRHMPDMLSEEATQAGMKEILQLQRPDGGWRVADLGGGTWKRDDDNLAQMPSDAYATAFAIVAIRHGGLDLDHDAVKRGIAWLKANQRVSGRWFTRSPIRGRKHFISHAATSLAVMAMTPSLFDDEHVDESP